MTKKLFALLLALALLFCGCETQQPEQTGTTPPPERPNTVGISLPDFAWSGQAKRLQALLEDAGYQVFLEYASGDVQLQCSQVQAFANMPVGCLVVAAIDSMSLSDVLADARQNDVPVIAYDRMLMYTDGVTGCVTVDNYGAGQQLGRYILEQTQPEAAKEPVTVEFFMGPPENQNSLLFYQGVMEQLQPYLASGVLQCRSGRTAFEDTCIQRSDADYASDRCFDYLTEFYEKDAPDVLCAATDTLAAGCISALTSFGLEPGEDWPLITGMGATEEGLENVSQGYQSITLHIDPEALVDQCVRWVGQAIKGEAITGETTTNGMTDVPAVWLPFTAVDAENCKDYLPQE